MRPAAFLLLLSCAACSLERHVELGFWFEPITYNVAGGPLTSGELQSIESTAGIELRNAFQGLRVTISHSRDALYTVVVVQQLWDTRFKRQTAIAGESRAVSGFGGSGRVNFELLAGNAIGYTPPNAGRLELLDAIGRGIGRAAVHEAAHQFLPAAPIHASNNINSYEYPFASRREQYYGAMEWGHVWPLLTAQLGEPISQRQLRNTRSHSPH